MKPKPGHIYPCITVLKPEGVELSGAKDNGQARIDEVDEVGDTEVSLV
jgi:hypothetical protein